MKMKTKNMIYLAMLTGIVQLSSCGSDEEKPQTLPAVETLTAVSTGTTTGTVTGEITDDGNATITEAGFVYSSNVDMPTVADNREEVTDFEEFSAELTGLSSGTVYNVRAYAINKKGIAYGTKRTLETGNEAPMATNVQVTGTLEVNQDLTASFTFTDPEGDLQGSSTYQWYVANDGTGTGETIITGATSATFHTLDEHTGKHLKVIITPKAQSGTLEGIAVSSAYTTAIGAETVTFEYISGVSVTYGTIVGPSGKKWLDRNLGAAHVAASITDFAAYGDLFQWGRGRDGHQLVTRSGLNNSDAMGINGTTSTKATSSTTTTNAFITDSSIEGDWITPQTSALWQGLSGINNPCPAGWRVPTKADWDAEGITNIDDAFIKLKLPRTGYRTFSDGSFLGTDLGGYYATSTPDETYYPNASYRARINATSYSTLTVNRGSAYACRCIKGN